MTMQLDWFPARGGGGPASGGSAMHMDWSRQWALPESEPATLSLAPGDPATGQPRLYPDRKPRPLAAGLDSWAAGSERFWGRHPPPRSSANPAGTAAGRREVGGSAPRREQAIAAASTASCSSSSSVPIQRLELRLVVAAEQAVPCSPASRAAENVSPAPTVSITFTATPGRSRPQTGRGAGDHAVRPERHRDERRPPAEPVVEDLLGRQVGEQPFEVFGADLDDVHHPEQLVHAAQHPWLPISIGQQLGS